MFESGDLALDPTNHEVIWVGKGRDNPPNSVSLGDGVYLSKDGGTTWNHHLGLEDTRHISRVIVHLRDPNTEALLETEVASVNQILQPHGLRILQER